MEGTAAKLTGSDQGIKLPGKLLPAVLSRRRHVPAVCSSVVIFRRRPRSSDDE